MPKKIVWKDRAKAELRAIEQGTALRILHALARVIFTGEGDVKRLHDVEPTEFRSASATTAFASVIWTTLSKSSQSNTAARPIAETKKQVPHRA
jgi:hypothetical protein